MIGLRLIGCEFSGAVSQQRHMDHWRETDAFLPIFKDVMVVGLAFGETCQWCLKCLQNPVSSMK
jgi:hypothetical protein